MFVQWWKTGRLDEKVKVMVSRVVEAFEIHKQF